MTINECEAAVSLLTISNLQIFFPVQVLILDPPRRGLACQSWRSGLPAGQEEVDRIRQSFLAIFILRTLEWASNDQKAALLAIESLNSSGFMFCNFLVLQHCVKYSLLVEIASRFTCPNECFFFWSVHVPMDPVAHVQWSLSDRVLPVVGSVRVIVYMSCGPRSFMQDAAMVVESIFGSFLPPFATQIWMCPHGFQFESIFKIFQDVKWWGPLLLLFFTLDRVLTLHRGCRMPIGSLVLALLQHLNYPGCAVTTCDLNRYWGYLGLGLDGTKAGKERETDWPWLIDAWNGQLQAHVVLKYSHSKGNSTECGEDIYTKRFRLSIASQASKSWIESH